jgi:hypothetical protein
MRATMQPNEHSPQDHGSRELCCYLAVSTLHPMKENEGYYEVLHRILEILGIGPAART